MLASKVHRLLGHLTMQSASFDSSRICSSAMEERLTAATLTWSRTCSTRMSSKSRQSGFMVSFPASLGLSFTTQCSTQITMYNSLAFRLCGLHATTGNTQKRPCYHGHACIRSASTTSTSTRRCFGDGSSMQSGRVYSSRSYHSRS